MSGDPAKILKINLFNERYDYDFLNVDASDDQVQAVVDQLKRNYISMIKRMVALGADINATDKFKRSALVNLGLEDNIDFVNLFTNNGVILDANASHRLTVICQESEEIQYAIAQALIDAKADINLMDQYGQSALMAACSNGNMDFATLLIKNGADVDQANDEGWTPLLNTASAEDIDANIIYDIAKLLLQNGANVNAANAYGETALLKAVYRNNEKMVKLLLEHGADDRITNKTGDSPLSVAKQKGYANILALFAE